MDEEDKSVNSNNKNNKNKNTNKNQQNTQLIVHCLNILKFIIDDQNIS